MKQETIVTVNGIEYLTFDYSFMKSKDAIRFVKSVNNIFGIVTKIKPVQGGIFNRTYVIINALIPSKDAVQFSINEPNA